MITSKKKKFIKLKQRSDKDAYVISFHPFCYTDDISKAKNYYPFAKLIAFINNIGRRSKLFSVTSGLSINAEFDTRFDMLQDTSLKAKTRRGLLFIVRVLERVVRLLKEKN